MLIFITAVLTALCVSALCSLLEATLLSFTPSQIAELERRRPGIAAVWRRFKQNIEKPIAVILILNTAAHTIGATIAGAQFEAVYGKSSLIAFSLIFTYLMLQFTEILPKTLGVRYNRALAPMIARPLELLVRVVTPVLWLVHLVNRPFQGRRRAEDSHTVEEISALASIALTANDIDATQERIIRTASRFRDLHARQIMTPRPQVDYLLLGQPMSEILTTVQKSAYTRLPLCDGSIDKVVGIVHMKDLFNHLKLSPGRLRLAKGDNGETIAIIDGMPGSAVHVIGSGDIDLLAIKRQAVHVPEQMPLPELLRLFQEKRNHMAIVVDEYGATQGIVTLEDVIEEFMGEIDDEFDTPVSVTLRKEGDVYRVSGLYPMHALIDELNVEDIDLGDVQTIGGYVTRELQRMPKPGDTVPLGTFTARVESIQRHRVDEVVLIASDAENRNSRS
ncbi:MAG TPA: hemolysin family protein [Phycisphaerae bacterium]|nr:hemolysin family protein [Phycisphaerae bacterium]HOJ74519.1 hemolysin family protein [Phycisphaerae bacterium]HOM53241.1 hemolysin family protein [Phycisphaerae bacterium]HON66372.1 hemolysin family protein [Phycisphaerae bacterium]HOQ86153.1 hemolysin family protein [Phycisphaerae bacterium]